MNSVDPMLCYLLGSGELSTVTCHERSNVFPTGRSTLVIGQIPSQKPIAEKIRNRKLLTAN